MRLFPILTGFAVTALTALPAQGPKGGDPTLPPTGLRIIFLDVDQGDCTILIGPTGTCMVVDAGGNGLGQSRVIPALQSLGVTQVTYAVASHYDTDHIGGLDEVINNFPVTSVWDRGVWNAPSSQSYRDYTSAAGARRATVGLGATFNLGGGATAQVLSANGVVIGGASYPIHTKAQFENAASVVLRVDYGDFSMWLGGDCTGGGNATYDMESKIAQACGDIDVLRVNHHGSNTSTNTLALGWLKPEVCVASAGFLNSFGHPTGTVTNRINSASDSRWFLCTTSGANSLRGFSRTGTITLVTDGFRYQITDVFRRSYDVYTDEVQSSAIQPGSLRISELHRSPSSTYGRYLEVYCQGPSPVNLRGLRISGNLGSFTVATPYRLLPGDRMLFQEHGDRSANGSQPLGHCWPYRAFSLGSLYDTLRLSWNTSVVDILSYNRNLAGGSGVASERTILDAPTSTNVFAAARRSFGFGDWGTPSAPNSVDQTSFKPLASMEILPVSTAGGAAIHMIATGFDHRNSPHALALSLGSSPGMKIGGTLIPLNPDVLFNASLLIPGAIGTIPIGGRRGLRVEVPRIPGLQGLPAYFGHVIMNPAGPVHFPAASQAFRFVFP